MARHSLNQAIAKTRQNYPFTIEAWILLPNLMRCIWTLPGGGEGMAHLWSDNSKIWINDQPFQIKEQITKVADQ